jgi:hypothetical protein
MATRVSTLIANKPSLFWPIVIAVVGAAIGAGLGLEQSLSFIQTVQQSNQDSSQPICSTGAYIIILGSPFFGLIIGAFPGIIAAIIVALRKQRDRKSDWAAYYGE